MENGKWRMENGELKMENGKMSRTSSWWTEGIRQGWLGHYETELIYFLREKYGGLTGDQQLVLVFLSLFLKSGHTTLPLHLSPREWGETIGLPPESVRLLSSEPIDSKSLFNSEGSKSGDGSLNREEVAGGDGSVSREESAGGDGSPSRESSIISEEPVSSRNPNLQTPSGQADLSDQPRTHSKNLHQTNSLSSDSLQQLTPLVISGNRVSFRRQSLYENFISDWISHRNADQESIFDPGRIASGLDKLYLGGETKIDWQKTATALSALRTFTIISGGPGTGKTTTVANLLTLRIRLAESPLRIALAAPTGKAAGRMAEALTRQWNRLGLTSDEIAQIPDEAQTIHRLLSRTEQRGLLPTVRHKTLPYDLIVVDEASMIDLHLMYRLLSHLDEKTTLILLGDRNQLASVEAGSVFSDLCTKQENSFSPGTANLLNQAGIESDLPVAADGPVADSIIYLTKSYRYDESSGIGRLSETVLSGDRDLQKDLFERYDDLHHQPFRFGTADFKQLAGDIYHDYLEASALRQPEELFSFWKQKIRLTVLRHSPSGSVRLNSFAEQQIMLKRPGLVRDGWYHGRPFIITQNDYALGIFNGDTGVCILTSEGELEVHVESGTGVKVFVPGQLVHAEPAYFLTVHKSQGSEYDQVHLMLPQNDTPILSRELIYTAISRARKSFHLMGEMGLFLEGGGRKTERYTGLGL